MRTTLRAPGASVTVTARSAKRRVAAARARGAAMASEVATESVVTTVPRFCSVRESVRAVAVAFSRGSTGATRTTAGFAAGGRGWAAGDTGVLVDGAGPSVT